MESLPSFARPESFINFHCNFLGQAKEVHCLVEIVHNPIPDSHNLEQHILHKIENFGGKKKS